MGNDIQLYLNSSYLEEKVLQHNLVHRCVSCQAFVSVAMRTKNDNSALATISNRASALGIYVIGGRNGIDSQLSSVERYNVTKDIWTPMVRVTECAAAMEQKRGKAPIMILNHI